MKLERELEKKSDRKFNGRRSICFLNTIQSFWDENPRIYQKKNVCYFTFHSKIEKKLHLLSYDRYPMQT